MQSWTLPSICCVLQVLGACPAVLPQQRRHLSIHEYQAMDLLQKNGISVPKYQTADTPQQAHDVAQEFGM